MYRELTAADHRRVLGITDDEVPDVLLLLGILDVEMGARRFAAYIEDPFLLREERKTVPAWLGRWKGLKVALAAALGAPMAAFWVHSFVAAGTPRVVQLGWYGALQHGTSLGDVVVPRHAERQDGASDWYLAKGILADATPALATAIATQIAARGITVEERAIFTTPALLAESREVIADWSRHGWLGVDMETAATFAVAKSLGAQRAAALIRIDDLVNEEHSLADYTPREVRAFMRARELEVTQAVLDAIEPLAAG